MSLSRLIGGLGRGSFCLQLQQRCAHSQSQVRLHLLEQLRRWNQQKPQFSRIVRAARLGGITLGTTPMLTTGLCKSKRSSEVNKRIEHLNKTKNSEPEPSLSFSDLWSILKPFFVWFAAAVLCAVGAAFVNVQLPLYLGKMIDAIVKLIKDQAQGLPVDIAIVRPFAYKLCAYYIAQAGLTLLYISFLTVLGERMASELRVRLFNRLLLADISFHDAKKSGELSSRLNVDVQEFKSCFKQVVAQGLKTITQIAGCVVTLFRLSPQMTFITLAAIPIVIALGSYCGSILRILSRKAQAQSAVAASVADEAFGNIRTVKSFAMEEQETALYNREIQKACYSSEILGFGIGAFQGGTNLFLNGVVLSVLYFGSGMIHSGHMTPGDLMSFLVTSQTVQKSLSQLSVIFGHALRGWTAGARAFEYINLKPLMEMDKGICIPYHTLWGEVKFEDVSFNYPSRPAHIVLENLNLSIPAGRVVALCGPSGEGKSTITALLERFYDPARGKITLDGKDLKELNLEWLRGQVIGLISQEPVLFASSIEENIRYGRPGATDEEVKVAAEMANADSFIRSFPDGYRTLVGERGTQLSGGQKQRIAIARALLKNPPILVLDEATSALDTESEQLVREALDRAMKGRTVLVIAHRLSTIQHADLIYVIKGKQVAESGTHQELMDQRGTYYSLVQSQTLRNSSSRLPVFG